MLFRSGRADACSKIYMIDVTYNGILLIEGVSETVICHVSKNMYQYRKDDCMCNGAIRRQCRFVILSALDKAIGYMLSSFASSTTRCRH